MLQTTKNRLTALNRWFDRIPSRNLISINAAIAALVGLAHGGALILTYYQPTPLEGSIRSIARFSLPVAAFVLLSALIVVFKRGLLEKMLAAHAGVFVVGAILTVGWAVSLAINGIPCENFSWTPGVLTMIVFYSVFLFRRAWLAKQVETSFVAMNLHLLSAVAVFPVEIAVLVRFVGTMRDRFHGF